MMQAKASSAATIGTILKMAGNQVIRPLRLRAAGFGINLIIS